jgi:G:T-mismatch repair DNA endonuclease (very short patch repair protein)
MPKLANNKKRDKKNRSKLAVLGWECLEIWDCQTGDSENLKRLLKAFLGS